MNDSLDISSIGKSNGNSIKKDESESIGNNISIINDIYALSDPEYDKKRIGRYFLKLWPKSNEKCDICYCIKCHETPLLHFNNEILLNLDKITFSCKYYKKQTQSIEEFFNDFILKESEIENEETEFLLCPICYQKFNYYCQNHDKNLCKNYNNEGDIHKNENLIRFEENIAINYIKYLIFKLNIGKELTNKESNEKDNKFEKFKLFKKLVEILITNYIRYPNYNIYQSIENLYEALSEFSIHCHKKKIKTLFKEGISINNKNQLNELEPDLYPLVININLRQTKAYNIEKLNAFENLRELNLSDNCIYDIKPFLKIEWKSLLSLNLATNKLGDTNIEYIENIDLKELTSLILDFNNFTNYDLFLAIVHNKKGSFKELEDLRLGFNNFRIGKNKAKNEKKKKLRKKTLIELVKAFNGLDLSKIKKLYLNHGALTQIAAKELLPIIDLKNLENLNIKYNYLKDLSFLEKCSWNLKIFSYKGNLLNEDDIDLIKNKFPNLTE